MLRLTVILFSFISFSIGIKADNTMFHSFSIKGTFPGMKDGVTVTLTRNIKDTLAVTKASNGSFLLSGEIDHPTIAILCIEENMKSAENRFPRQRSFSMMIDKGETMVSAVSFDSVPPRAADYQIATRMRDNISVSGTEVQKHYEEYIHTEDGSETFCANHPNYAVSLAIADKRMGGIFVHTRQEMDSLVSAFRNNEDTLLYRLFCEKIDSLRPYAKGIRYTDLSVQSIDGSEHRLSEFIKPGQWNFIDLWASWCMPCRAAIPEVRKMYDKANGKINVISLSMDSKQAAWLKAVEEENMPWKQLIIANQSIATIKSAYKLTTIPYLIVISPEGGIEFVSKNARSATQKILKIID